MKQSYNRVVVTGGSGFLGQKLLLQQPNWSYISSKELNLLDNYQFYEYVKDTNVDAIIHLAAKTGGIKHSVSNQSDFYYYNSIINLNVLRQSYEAGIKRVLSCLSTCCYPDVANTYPMTEKQFMVGEPTDTNYGYGLAKRELYQQSNFYRKFYNLNYSTFTPCNLYGPGANFDSDTSHFIASLIKKISNAKDGEKIILYGDGTPLRQHLYIDDLAKLIPILLESHNSELPINVAPDENLSIKEIAKIAIQTLGKNIDIEFNNKLTGQKRKDVSNKELIKLIGDVEWTPLNIGIQKTYEWYRNNI